MENRRIIGIALVIIGLLGFAIFVPLYAPQQQTYVGYGPGWGMMGPGMMGGYNANPSGQTITMDQAVQLFESYLTSLHNPDLAIDEVEEYQNNFYAAFYEKSTGVFAFQMLIWKPGAPPTGWGMMSGGIMGGRTTSGVVVPEPGPNMMWNTGYGMMDRGMMGYYGQGTSASMTTSRDQAKAIAQQYLDSDLAGKTAGDVDTYYGYYTIDVLLNGATFGMFSVNGYTGQVWYHSWHGQFIQVKKF
jgi:hypothetical protein